MLRCFRGTCFYVFLQNSTTISLLLRYLDLSVGAYEVLEVQCPHGTPAPVPAAPSPRPPSTTGVSPPVVPNPKVLCSSHQMAVELPAGAISGIYVKGLCVNMLAVHVWLPSSLRELERCRTGPRWHPAGWGWGRWGLWVWFWLGNTSAGSVCPDRHQRKPGQTPGCPEGLWLLRKEKQTWQNSAEIPVAPALSHERAGKDLGFGFFYLCVVHLCNM